MHHEALVDQKLLFMSVEQVGVDSVLRFPLILLLFAMGIGRLPTELLQQVLQKAASELGPHGTRPSPNARRLLLAVCFQWRDIVLNTPELWSYVSVYMIKTIYDGKESTFRNALATLDLDLQRSGSQLLDVYWYTYLDRHHAHQVLKVIMARAPFCRWRSLDIDNDSLDSCNLPSFRPEDKFCNLVTLYIRFCHRNGFVPHINRTISSRFRFFITKDAKIPPQLFNGDLTNLLSVANELSIPDFRDRDAVAPPLPKHIVTLIAQSLHLQETGHIQHLTLQLPTRILEFVSHNWSSLISLDVRFDEPSSWQRPPQTPVNFPCLQTLSVHGARYDAFLHISAPQLARLRLDRGHFSIKASNQNLYHIISCPSYPLSHITRFEICFPLEPLVLTKVIVRSPALQALRFGIGDSYDGWELIRHVICERRFVRDVGIVNQEGAYDAFMGQIDTLELDMNWRNGGVMMKDTWKAYMSRILEDTQGKPLETIKCFWPDGDIRQLTRPLPSRSSPRVNKLELAPSFDSHWPGELLLLFAMSISKLPTELLQQVLLEAASELGPHGTRPSPKARRLLLAVCFQWRDIVLNTPKLWAYVIIYMVKMAYHQRESTFQNALAALDLDLQRSGSQLLDICWYIDLERHQACRVLEVFMARAPFCRWRSLDLQNERMGSYKLPSSRHEDTFCNLVTLRVHHCNRNGFLPHINRTISSRFRFFCTEGAVLPVKLFTNGDLTNLLAVVTELSIPNFRGGGAPAPPLPKHIVTLVALSLHLQETGHIQHLVLRYPTQISEFVSYDWSSLISLDVDFHGKAFWDGPPPVSIIFPRLQNLSVRGGYYDGLLYMSAPQVARLRFDRGDSTIKVANQNLDYTISDPSYSLSHITRLEISFPLEPLVLNKLIAKFPALKMLRFDIDDSYEGWELLKHVICEQRSVNNVDTPDQVGVYDAFMGQLDTLELEMSWKGGGVVMRDTWKAYMSRILKDTHGKPLETIKCFWPDGDTRQLTRGFIVFPT
ncbi:hypothetical protein FRC17_010153 [Serendipita sp. 399]|nr:hypothetical protein FRC17_010153 [Serendipita sp. 399]